MAELETLLAVAEISVALAGFSAVVVLFKRQPSGKWRAADAARFQGMIIHAMIAVLFCIIPFIIRVFTPSPAVVWSVSSGVLGLWTATHVTVIMRLFTTRTRDRLALSLGFAFAGLQFFNVVGVGFDHEFPPFLAGVLWHLLQAGFLFVWLVLIDPEDIESE